MKRLILLLIISSFAIHVSSIAAEHRPNVLFIAVDDLRTSLGCYGDAVLTGRLPDNTRVWHNRNLFRDTQPDIITLPQHFKNHGYHTVSLGKVFSGDERELDPAAFELKDDGQRVRGISEHAWHTHRELGGYRSIPEDEHPDAATTRMLRHGYHACVSYTDAQIGKLLAALDQLGLAQNTIVVLWGDHGWSLGEKDRWCKGTNFERDTRVPLLIRSPALQAPGAAASGLVELVDVFPTLAELASLPAPQGLDGRSLVPMLADPQSPGREAVLSQFARPFSANTPEFMGYSLRTASHRYTHWINWQSSETVAEELYDYSSGPSTCREGAFWIEEETIAADSGQAETRRALSQHLDAMLSKRITAEPKAQPATKTKRKKKQP